MATWPVVSGNPVPSTNLNELNQRMSNTVEAIGFDEVNTAETTSSTTFTDLATAGPAVTVTCPSSKAMIVTSAFLLNNSAAISRMSFEVTGASTVAAAASFGPQAKLQASDAVQVSYTHVLTGLSTGSNTFTAKYSVATGSTGEFRNRKLFVFPLGG